MTQQEKILVEEIKQKYGSVGKMIASVANKVDDLRSYGGHMGRDGADTLEVAMRDIPVKFHSIFFKYAHSSFKP